MDDPIPTSLNKNSSYSCALLLGRQYRCNTNIRYGYSIPLAMIIMLCLYFRGSFDFEADRLTIQHRLRTNFQCMCKSVTTLAISQTGARTASASAFRVLLLGFFNNWSLFSLHSNIIHCSYFNSQA